VIGFPAGDFLAQATEVLIGTLDGDHVLLRNWRYSPDEWTFADGEIHCGPWQGRIRVSFYRDELIRFANEIRKLYRDLHGEATLHPMEPYLILTLIGNGRGGITVDGCAQSESGFVTGTKLCFHFSIDQTFLPRIADGLVAANSR
jgi:hypothetical protein